MPDQLANDSLNEEELRKARRAEINRQNAQHSTGPNTESGKMNSRINGLKNGSRTVIVDLTDTAGLAILSGEDATEYRRMVAAYSRYLSPRDPVETAIVQRIVDTQWRLVRNSWLQTLEFEGSLDSVRTIEHPGLSPHLLGAVDMISATRLAFNSKMPQHLQREQANLVRLIQASLKELSLLRKLNPMPNPPVRPSIEYQGPNMGPIEEMKKFDQAEVEENTEQIAQSATDRSQVTITWRPVFERPAKPLARSVGSSVETNAFSDQPEPPY